MIPIVKGRVYHSCLCSFLKKTGSLSSISVPKNVPRLKGPKSLSDNHLKQKCLWKPYRCIRISDANDIVKALGRICFNYLIYVPGSLLEREKSVRGNKYEMCYWVIKDRSDTTDGMDYGHNGQKWHWGTDSGVPFGCQKTKVTLGGRERQEESCTRVVDSGRQALTLRW